uniref:Odorant receptor n=1 Tax=Eogystia hippophaecolus TaxID=1206364 RepID=A0A1B3P5P7_EOGHI|nr:odorant receptor [Eogystia hippophaecolus]
MPFYQIIKNFILKAYFDFDNSYISLYNFHPQLRIFIAINGIFFNNRDSKIRYIWPIFGLLLTFVGFTFELIFIYHGLTIQDYSFATESFCYTIILGVIPIVYTTVLLNKEKIIQLIEDMNGDFIYICRLGSEYKKRFLKGQLYIWILCFMWLMFLSFVAVVFIMTMVLTLMYQSLFATQDEYTIRPLIFPMWLPEDDPYRTPNYEIFLFLQIILIFICNLTFGVYVYILFHILLHYYYLMDMIMLAFGVLFDGLDESVMNLPRSDVKRIQIQRVLNNRMKQIVRWHTSVFKSVDTVSSVYGSALVYQVMFSSLAICLMAYQVAVQLDEGKVNFLFIILSIAACLQLWIPCYLGTIIRNKAFAVGDACWNSGWHETSLGRLLRQDIIIFILRAQHPVTIKFTGLPPIQLETFSSIMSTSYSYFNMLRQYK